MTAAQRQMVMQRESVRQNAFGLARNGVVAYRANALRDGISRFNRGQSVATGGQGQRKSTVGAKRVAEPVFAHRGHDDPMVQ